MFVKVPIYVDVKGSVQDPSMILEALRVILEDKLISGKPKKRLPCPKHIREVLLESGENPESFTLIPREKILEGLR